jgi:hypothetical protein
MKRTAFALVAAGLFLAAAPQAALAQAGGRGPDVQEVTDSFFARDRNTSVRERPRPDYEAIGVHAGAFNLFPRLTAEAELNDNIYAGPSGFTESDLVFHIRPEIGLRSNWNVHQLNAYARANFNRFSENETENTEEYGVGANGRLDIVRGSNLYAGADYQKLTEPRTAPTAPAAAAKPTEYTLFQGNVGGVHEFNRLRVSGRFDYSDFDYDNNVLRTGAPLLQDDRDREVAVGTARAEYAVSPATAFFVAGRLNSRDYRLAVGADGFNRDSSGYAATAGVNFDVSAVARGEIEVGYLNQDYDDARLRSIRGMALAGRVEWFPTELTTIGLSVTRSVEEATVAGASGFLSTGGGVQIDHELLRNVLLNAQASYTEDQYRGVDRKDKRTAASAGATYLLNHAAALSLTYSYYRQNSTGLAGSTDYDVNKLLLSLILQL